MKRRSFITSSTSLAVGAFFTRPTMAQDTHNKKTKTIETDILVCGGGPSGVAAGRCISGSHEAHSSYRVQQIAMAIGSGAGVAAALANRDRVDVRKVDKKKMQKILFNE